MSIHINNESMWMEQALTHLRKSISPQCFKAYFADVKFRAEGLDGACVLTPTRHAKESLEKVFKREILQAVQVANPRILRLEFVVASKSASDSAVLGAVLSSDPQLLNGPTGANGQSANASHHAPSTPHAGNPGKKGFANSNRSGHSTEVLMELPLSPAFKLSNFEHGVCNKTACSAAQTVVESPGTIFNPLFIHGAHGLGKSHLLQGVALGLKERDRNARVLYTTGEAFANAYLAALHAHNLDAFRAHFRHCTALVIDDVHFLLGKAKTQEELFHTIQFLRASGRQIVLGSSLSLAEMHKLNSSLLEIMRAGLVIQLDTPEFELRVKLLHALATRRNWEIEDDAARAIATHVEHSVGALDGALCKTLAVARATGEKASVHLALGALRDLGHVRTGPLTLHDVLAATAKFYRLTPDDIRSDKRAAALVHARHIAIHLAKHLTSHTTVELGRFFGNRDHTSILHAVRKISGLLKREESVREEHRLIKQALGR